MAEVDNLRWKYINDLKYKFKKNCFTDLVGSSFVFEHRLSLINKILIMYRVLLDMDYNHNDIY